MNKQKRKPNATEMVRNLINELVNGLIYFCCHSGIGVLYPQCHQPLKLGSLK